MAIDAGALTGARVTTRGAGGSRAPRRRRVAWAGVLPFAAYVIIFLALPTILAVYSGFQDASGAFTLANLRAFTDPQILQQFGTTILVSAVTAVIGAVVGALVCFALLGTRVDGWLRTLVDSAASVFAQFGGVMLAFAFVATVGAQGLVTTRLVRWGWADNPFSTFGDGGPMLYQTAGLVLVYLYFQIPLMVITFMPALEGLKASWAEANATLGGTRFTYWARIGIPVLAPAFLGSLVLLFANAFSSYATAAALIPQGGIIPLAIRNQLTSETILGLANVAGVLALGMVLIMIVLMTVYALLQRRARRWQR